MARQRRGSRPRDGGGKKYSVTEMVSYLTRQNARLFGATAHGLRARSVGEQLALCRALSASCQRMRELDAAIARMDAGLARLARRLE